MSSSPPHSVSDTRLKVVIVRDRPSAGGGIYNYYDSITKYLSAAPHFTDVGRPFSFYGTHGGAKVRFTAARLFLDWFALFLKILRVRPAIVLINPCMDPPFNRSLRRDAINILIARLLGRPVLSFWRGWDNAVCGQAEFPGGNKGILSRIYRLSAAHIVLSEQFKADLVRWKFETPVYVETTVVADNCLAAAPQSLQLGRRPTDLLYLSRVEIAKGVFELLEAYEILKKKNPAYTLTIAGDGPDLDELKARAKEMDLKDVHFPGYVSGAAKVDCYRQGGVFCFLSYTEGMPNAVLEALAMGLPIISSDAGGLRDILRDRENGFIVLPNSNAPLKKKFDAAAVADAIERLVETPELHERISTVNLRYARQRFSAPVVAKRLETICRSLMSDATVPSAQPESAKPVCVE